MPASIHKYECEALWQSPVELAGQETQFHFGEKPMSDSRTHGLRCREGLRNSSQHGQNNNAPHAIDYLKSVWWSLTKSLPIRP